MASTYFVLVPILVALSSVSRLTATAETYAIFMSNDSGQSWTRSDSGMPPRSRINAFESADKLLLTGTDNGIFVSRDGALNWQPAAGVAVTAGRIISLAALNRRVFAGTDGKGLLVSTNAGASWALNTSFPSDKVRCLLAHGDQLYAGTDRDGVFVSNDSGRVWTHLATGLPSHAQVFALSTARATVFAGLYSGGLYAWDDQKHAWTRSGSVTPLALAGVADTLIVGHNPGGLYWSDEPGVSWTKGVSQAFAAGTSAPFLADDSGELSSRAPVWGLGAGGGVVFAGASAGIYYSEDRGRTWTRARRGLPEASPGLAFLVQGKFVLAGTLLKERDGQPRTESGSGG